MTDKTHNLFISLLNDAAFGVNIFDPVKFTLVTLQIRHFNNNQLSFHSYVWICTMNKSVKFHNKFQTVAEKQQ